jgi:hypothetical protein
VARCAGLTIRQLYWITEAMHSLMPRSGRSGTLSDRGLEDTDTAIASIFHEIYHQRSRQIWGHGGTEGQAEEYGQRMLAEYRRRTGRR